MPLKQFLKSNYRYTRGFFIILILFPFIDYIIMGERILALLIIEGIIFSVLMTFIFRIYFGPDIGIYQLESQFSVSLNKSSLIEKLRRFVESKRGYISESEDSIVIRLGGKYSIYQLLGYEWLSKRKDFMLPCKVEVIITEKPSQIDVKLYYRDDISDSFARVKRYETVYRNYFARIDASLRDLVKKDLGG